jgi:hypothetical protein
LATLSPAEPAQHVVFGLHRQLSSLLQDAAALGCDCNLAGAAIRWTGPALGQSCSLKLIDQRDHRAGIDAHRRADFLLISSLVSPEDVEEREERRGHPKRLECLRKARIAMTPAPSHHSCYGMPAYAKDRKVVSFCQNAQKFNSRYATFGFNDEANLDEGTMWPTSFALTKLTAANEAKIGALVQKAVS